MPFFKDVKLLRAVCCWGMRLNGMRMDKLKREVYGWLVRGEDAAVGCTSIWADTIGGEYDCGDLLCNHVGLFILRRWMLR